MAMQRYVDNNKSIIRFIRFINWLDFMHHSIVIPITFALLSLALNKLRAVNKSVVATLKDVRIFLNFYSFKLSVKQFMVIVFVAIQCGNCSIITAIVLLPAVVGRQLLNKTVEHGNGGSIIAAIQPKQFDNVEYQLMSFKAPERRQAEVFGQLSELPLTKTIVVDRLQRIIKDGLGMKKLPDMQMINISQTEYVIKYNEYLRRLATGARLPIENVTDKRIKQRKHNTIGGYKRRKMSSLVPATRQHRVRQKMSLLSYTATQILSSKHNYVNSVNNNTRYRRNIPNNMADSYLIGANNKEMERAPNRTEANDANGDDSIYLRFSVRTNRTKLPKRTRNVTIIVADATLRFVIACTRRKHNKTLAFDHLNHIEFHIYQLLEPKGRRKAIDSRQLELPYYDVNNLNEDVNIKKNVDTQNGGYHRWLEFDVQKAVADWLTNNRRNFGFEIVCTNCRTHGVQIIYDPTAPHSNVDTGKQENYQPVLNVIITTVDNNHKPITTIRQQHYSQLMDGTLSKSVRKTDCTKTNTKCCRHRMNVIFKEIKGFEFIIQPKTFDAGFCRGKCPPRYNPAHHHALLQSLIWKQDRSKVPRPCCAPSKLVELEVLHVDEEDPSKLKVSSWNDMRVTECACS